LICFNWTHAEKIPSLTMARQFLAAAAALLVGPAVLADMIAIIGAGDVGGALGPAFAKRGHTIVYGSRDPDRDKVTKLVERTGRDTSVTNTAAAAAKGDIVALAVPGLLIEEITLSLGDLSGKIIIDPTNPLERNFMRLEHAAIPLTR
jgi:predicted dinucleotide-binding enzyme